MGRAMKTVRRWWRLAAVLLLSVAMAGFASGCGETQPTARDAEPVVAADATSAGMLAQEPAAQEANAPGASAPGTNAAGAQSAGPAAASAGMAGAPAAAGDVAQIPEAFRAPKGGWPKTFTAKYTKAVAVEGITDPKDAHYDIWVPEKYSPETAAPLVIVLHGGPGGRAIGLASVFAMGFAEMGAISVYPQALRNDVMLEWNYPHEGAFLLAIIKQVAKQYRIDPKRIYLMGHSMGGGGTWHNGAILNEVWAGIAPLSGWYGPTPHPPVELLKEMPTYIIHGDKDMNVLVSRSQVAVAEFKRMKKTNYVYKELEGVGHQEYLNKNPGRKELMPMAKWLLEQKREQPADLAAAEKALAKWGGRFGWSPEGGVLGRYQQEGGEPKNGARTEKPAAEPRPANPAVEDPARAY